MNMPKLGMEPIRRAALIDAAIAELRGARPPDVTVAQIARRAGVSSALAHHYFGGKEQILLAAMRHVMTVYSAEVLARLKAVEDPSSRLAAIVGGAFAPSNFGAETVAAWLNFYVLALSSDEARRLHRIYRARLLSNLRSAFRPLAGARAAGLAEETAALIDGVYLNQGLSGGDPDGRAAEALVMAAVWAGLRAETAGAD